MNYILRCITVPARVVIHAHARIGKSARRHIRHQWNMSHHTARYVWRGTQIVCVAVAATGTGVVWGQPMLVQDYSPQAVVVDVPEPAGVWMLGLGLIILGVTRHGR